MKPINQLKELYDKYPGSRIQFTPPYAGLESYLKDISDLSCFKIEELETLQTYQQNSLMTLLTNLPQKVAVKVLGEEIFVWAVLYGYERVQKEKIKKTIRNIIGKNPRILRQAGRAVTDILGLEKTNVKTINRNYELIQEFERLNVAKINLAKLLEQNAQKGVILSKERLQDCSLEKLTAGDSWNGYDNKYGNNKMDGVVYDVYLDAPLALVFLYKELPNALISILASSSKTLQIQQIQGITPEKIDKEGLRTEEKRKARGLAPLDWTKLLVDCVEQIGKELEFEEISIQSTHNNTRAKETTNNNDVLTLERSIKIYDSTAKRAGFRKRKDQNWYKKLA
ncbi:hypothetical protein HZA97_09215 [Candidatus Woesearchaeota archaeon]|nr:hypothetical protein [Candidatus Woesearchaeota archaeon]